MPRESIALVDHIVHLLGGAPWRCHRCGHQVYRLRRNRPRVRICVQCRSERSITSGTFLHGQHDLRRWLHAARWLLSTHPGSIRSFARAYGCARSTAMATFHRLHAAPPMAEPADAPLATAFVPLPGRPDQPRPTRPVPSMSGDAEAHRLPAVVFCGPTRTTAARHEAASVWFAGDLGPPDTPADAARSRARVHGRAHAFRSWACDVIRRGHRAVSPRWRPAYLHFLCWRFDRPGRRRLGALFLELASRPPRRIRDLAPVDLWVPCPWRDADDQSPAVRFSDLDGGRAFPGRADLSLSRERRFGPCKRPKGPIQCA